MPLNVLRSLFADPTPYSSRREGVIVNANVPAANLRALREIVGEPPSPHEPLAGSRVLRDPDPTAALFLTPAAGFSREQVEAVTDALAAMVQAFAVMLEEALPPPAAFGEAVFPFARVFSGERVGASVHRVAGRPHAVLRLPAALGFTAQQQTVVGHETSHLVAQWHRLTPDPTHDVDQGVSRERTSTLLRGLRIR